MIYCIYCGTPSDDSSNFCPHCGAKLVKPYASDRQTYTPADGAYAGPTEENFGQTFAGGSTQTETPTYHYTPYGENMYCVERTKRKSPGKAPSILSLVFGVISIFMIASVYTSLTYDPYGSAFALVIISVFFTFPSVPLGIVGLVNSIKARAVPGIVMASVGLGLVVSAYSLLGLI